MNPANGEQIATFDIHAADEVATGVSRARSAGTQDFGFGRIHGPDGLRDFARSRAITRQRFDIPLKVTTFARTEKAVRRLRQIARVRLGECSSAALKWM